ncbi:MAG: Uncharacterised protein [Flavobacterium sp. SCGC AAA160-P02]|nr:MAG: Uncharacterised protein [Flavobacterium sp. SCGC AAA160-P02]
MKKYKQIIILSSLFILFSFSHPIKLTSSIIKYDSETKVISMECKVFIDDFAPAIGPNLENRINNKSLTKDDLLRIENYFITNYKIFIDGNKLPLAIDKYKVANNVMTLSFYSTFITLKKGNKLNIENELLFEKFPDLQSNWMTIQIPPFLPNYNFESKFENYLYSYTF